MTLIDSFIVETDAYSVVVYQNRLGEYSVSVYKKVVKHAYNRVDTINETNETFSSFVDCMSFVGDRLGLK